MNETKLSRHGAKILILRLLIAQSQKWTFGEGVDDQIPAADRAMLRKVRDEYVVQLQSQLTFARKAAER